MSAEASLKNCRRWAPRSSSTTRIPRPKPRSWWDRCKRTGGRAMAWQADVSRRDQVIRMFEAVGKEFGRLDVLVNNAAIFFSAQFESLTEEQWDRIMNSNLKSTFLCSQAATPMLRASGGQIINMSSLGGLLSWPSYTHYCVSKAGVIMLTRCMARALAPEIRVNSIAPGHHRISRRASARRLYPSRPAPSHRNGRGHHQRRRVPAGRRLRDRPDHRGRWRPAACLIRIAWECLFGCDSLRRGIRAA